MPRLPIVPTAIVAAAVATMIALGFWQLQRREWKETLLARYETSMAMSAMAPWPRSKEEQADLLYRKSSLTCERVTGERAVAGRSLEGRSGWMHLADCEIDGGGKGQVALGWSPEPFLSEWAGGAVQGTIAPAGDTVRLIAEPPQAGLQALASPDPQDLPNNHLSYAVQWFFFAMTAVVIYLLALRKKQSAR